jgi:alpha-amylase
MLRDIGICLVVSGGLAGCQPSASPRSPEAATVTVGPARAALVRPRSVDGHDIPYNGSDDGTDVLLQGFHWTSHAFNQNGQRWYGHLASLLPEITAGFTAVWLPPPSASAANEGYMPGDWANLDSQYGSAQDLRALIAALHAVTPPVKAIADIVINHRSAKGACSQHDVFDQYDYSSFGMGGPDFMDHSVDDIDKDDKHGDDEHMLSGANEGTWSHNSHLYENEDFVGSPDLNHWNNATRNTIKAWLKWLKEDSNAGFDGWRYDMIGGYDPTFLGEYNFDSQPYLSVGEKPTGDRQYLADIVNRAGNQTMVFDFAMREAVVRALDDVNQMDGAELGVAGAANTEKGLVGWWSNTAVTFVNNHDTQPDHTPVGQVFPWGVPGSSSGVSTQAAYAFILTHPGIPTVFFLDWKERGSDLSGAIDNLIRIRKANRVFRNSRVFVDRAEDGLYAAYVGEENTEKLAVKIGKTGWNNYETWVPNPALGLSQAFTRFEASGHAYCVFYRNAVPLSN